MIYYVSRQQTPYDKPQKWKIEEFKTKAEAEDRQLWDSMSCRWIQKRILDSMEEVNEFINAHKGIW